LKNRQYETSNLKIFAPAAQQLDDFLLKIHHYGASNFKMFAPAARHTSRFSNMKIVSTKVVKKFAHAALHES